MEYFAVFIPQQENAGECPSKVHQISLNFDEFNAFGNENRKVN